MASLEIFNLIFNKLQTLGNLLEFKVLKARYWHSVGLRVELLELHINGMVQVG